MNRAASRYRMATDLSFWASLIDLELEHYAAAFPTIERIRLGALATELRNFATMIELDAFEHAIQSETITNV